MSNASEFNGGKFYGSLPDFTMGVMMMRLAKDAFIPKLSVDQMNASLCSWFGVDDSMMTTLFPNLGYFKTGSAINSAYLEKNGTKLFS
ncbi:MAG: hypothetical protein CM15mP88_1810 [Pseudomonadota bacterium]|nr:MAG: hypothetical protein CM15mP88_1810 [Pseudomonadota bacterium]